MICRFSLLPNYPCTDEHEGVEITAKEYRNEETIGSNYRRECVRRALLTSIRPLCLQIYRLVAGNMETHIHTVYRM